MAQDIIRIKVVPAEQKRANKWLAETFASTFVKERAYSAHLKLEFENNEA